MHNISFKYLRFILYISLLGFINSCATSSFTFFPTEINSKILASFDINPNANNRPSPLVVRIYELKSLDAFNEANFFKLYDEEAATLGGDLLSRDEFELSPGQGTEINRKVNQQTRYFAVIAAFRNIEQSNWRASKILKLNSDNTLVVKINKQSVSIENL
ncbi:Type VI secretion lipoprotein/VasD [hydrothermal vent metagenome]|uniref:Type VI secretion lipoprotein/VasD n=1 Tax=hydrothermal vent metagenome TaxID=652676 RepID=A0A3B0WQC6_9ZZZZ